jgi:glutathione S-transferase
MSEAWLHLRSTIAAGIYNINSSRCRNPSLEKRREGWTEVWGQQEDVEQHAWLHEEEVISRALATPYPQLPMTLFQHRPAWFEQLVLRFAGVAHIVVNSPYVATEVTGPLPYLRDIHPGKPACLIPSNSMLEYLHKERNVHLDESLSPSQQALSHAYASLIKSQLEPALLSLRFGDDDAWNQVYRQQYIRGGSAFQAWCIRMVGKQQLKQVWSVDESCTKARDAYQSFTTQLGDSKYLLCEEPATLDALMWAHLAEALCNVHLVVILAEFPRLVEYFQRIYDTYFRLNVEDEWKMWNHEQNLRSPFQSLPMEETSSNKPSTFHDALELMQSFSVHQHDLKEVLVVAKEKRLLQESEKRDARHNTLYRWRMGDDILPPKTSPDPEEMPTEQQVKWRKTHKRNDELWLSAVVAATAIAVFFGSVRNSR